MPKILTVSEVRRAIYLAAGGGRSSGPGEKTTALLGQLFHETFRLLTGPDPAGNLVRPLERADRTLPSWEAQLREHAYLWCVGPQLVRHQAELQTSTQQVLAYWEAVEHLCRWLCGVLFRQIHPAQAVEEVRRYIFAENELECQAELADPEWEDTVILQGRVDAVLRQPGTGRLCAVELKLGQTRPDADLAQACLYHLLLSSAGGQGDQDLALWSFQPAAREFVWKAHELGEAQARLKDLIGSLAQVGRHKEPIPSEPARGGKPLADMARRLLAVFAEFGAPIQLEGEPLVGPTFYRFRAKPAQRVKADRILNMATTIWPRLKMDAPPQIALAHGVITIDVQRPDREAVPWHPGLVPKGGGAQGSSSFPVGLAVDGRWVVADLAETEHAHFLVAGSTGSGKSEWLRMTLGSLCAANTPRTLSLVLIDPKRTAFNPLKESPFLLRPIIYPADEDILAVLEELIRMMEERYRCLEQAGSTDLREYNRRFGPLPRVVCLCDEYADLVLADSRAGKEVERKIMRLGSKGRAAGIHLILATQRPSKDVVKGVIRSNLNARVVFKVNERLDSRIILEQAGAETLLGKGDMLFKDLGEAIRLQSPLISDEDLRRAAS